MKLEDNTVAKLKYFEASRVTIQSSITTTGDRVLSISEEDKGVTRLVVISDYDGDEINGSVPSTVLRFIINNTDFRIEKDSESGDVIFSTEDRYKSITTKIGMSENIETKELVVSRLNYLELLNKGLKFGDFSKGTMLSKEGVFASNDIVKCYCSMKLDVGENFGFDVYSLRRLQSEVDGAYFEDDNTISKVEVSNQFLYKVTIRKIISRISSFIGYVEGLEYKNKTKVNKEKLMDLIRIVPKDSLIDFKNDTVEIKDKFTTYIESFDMKLFFTIKASLLESIIKKLDEEIEIFEYEDLLRFSNKGVNFIIRKEI